MHHFRIFGSLCHRHIPDERRKKLDDKSENLILVGYHPIGPYKVYNSAVNQVIINRYVVVDEPAAWKQEGQSGSQNVPCVLEEKDRSSGHVVESLDARRSQRVKFPSTRLADHELLGDHEVNNDGELVYFAFFIDSEPVNWRQAVDIKEWENAMMEDLEAIERNKIWELVDLPGDKHHIDVKWVF